MAETDCACAPAMPSGLPSAIGKPPPAGLWGLSPSLYRAPLPDGYHLAFNPVGPAGVVVLNPPAAQMLDSFATPAPLADPTAHQLAALGLLAPQPPDTVTFHASRHVSRLTLHASRFTPPASRFTPPALTIWLHLTTRCNLRCAYCYAPRGDADMSPEVGQAAVEGAIRAARAGGFRALKLKYAGGEPTLNLPTLRAVHEYARARTAQAGLELREVLLTNGTTLTPALLSWLRDEGIRLAVSLDGLGPAHDGQRMSADGNGSFARVARGLEQAMALGLTPHLSVTVTTYNVDRLAEVVASALDRKMPFNLNFVRPAPGRPDLNPEPERLIAGLRAALDEIERRLQSVAGSLPFALCNLLDRCDFGLPHRYPCGAGHAYLVVGPEGRVARCHMEMERTAGTVWEEDPLAAVRAEDGFRNPPVEEKEECRECPWRYICAGGCPLMAQRHRGTPLAPSPYCAVYRAVLPDLLRLEGLRIMRTHGTP
ncbi:MAG: SPASM domain-containing protein [Thermoflexales bacterium]|nr:SPASM domain-containing protein [Thermoflexales bacterium]